MRKLTVLPILGMLLVWVAFSWNGVQTSASTPDYALTATHIIQMATATAKGIDSPTPFAGIAQTLTVAPSTRTAIALTRDPSLAISPTPNPIELTATQIIGEVTETKAAYTPPGPGTLSLFELTATEVIIRATQTAAALATNPALIFTPSPISTSDSCKPSVGNYYQSDLVENIQLSLLEAGIEDVSVAVVTIGVGCGSEFYPIVTGFSVQVLVSDTTDRARLTDLTVAILSVLADFPPEEAYGSEQARLMIMYRLQQGFGRQYIDTGYANALAAYNEGLRGEALLEALGGLLPG